MHLWSGRPALLSLGVSIAAYASGTILAGLIAVHAVHRIGVAVLDQLAPAARRSVLRAETPPAQPAIAASTIRREASMTPLSDRWAAQSQPRALRLAAGPQFGSSSRNASRWSGPYERRPSGSDDDDDDRPELGGTYRTLCVRLCDGYYFPVSFAAGPDHIERDRAVCESRCGAQGRLFVHRNPGGSVEDMEDLRGRPYRQLRTAFLYRSQYVPSCSCQPHPWEAASQDRHRVYALAIEARNGSKDAVKELQALQAKARQAAKPPDQAAALPAPDADAAAPSSRDAELARRDGESLMRLGGSGAPGTRADPRPPLAPDRPRSDPDWIKRAFQSGSGG
jgi:hypothetical protein